MMKFKQAIVPAVLACVLGATAASAQTYTTTITTTTRHYGAPAVVYDRIGMLRAQEIAVGERPGNISNGELVRDAYGRPIYVFDINNRYGIYTVSVDANSGRVISDVEQGVRYHRANFWDRLFAPTHFMD